MSKKKDKLKNKDSKDKEGEDMEKVIERPCTPAESLKQSLKEMKLIREGKLPRRNLDDFLNQLEKEIKSKE